MWIKDRTCWFLRPAPFQELRPSVKIIKSLFLFRNAMLLQTNFKPTIATRQKTEIQLSNAPQNNEKNYIPRWLWDRKKWIIEMLTKQLVKLLPWCHVSCLRPRVHLNRRCEHFGTLITDRDKQIYYHGQRWCTDKYLVLSVRLWGHFLKVNSDILMARIDRLPKHWLRCDILQGATLQREQTVGARLSRTFENIQSTQFFHDYLRLWL